jgi:molybdenum cofactor cytidylyltransferase
MFKSFSKLPHNVNNMIGAVILAAGESKRMGGKKLILEVKGKPIIQWVVESFKGIVDDIVVVLGHEPETIIPLLRKLEVRWTINNKYMNGMASSFKEGLEKLKNCESVFLALGDQPFVDKEFLLKAIDAWRNQKARIVSPVYKGKKGHPVLFDRSLFNEILSLDKQKTIRDIIHAHADELHLIETGKWAILDMDVPEDLTRFTSLDHP